MVVWIAGGINPNLGVGDMTFFNIVFDAHQVFCADGLPVESFLPTPAAMGELDETVRDDLAALFECEAENGGDFPTPRYTAPEIDNYRPAFV